MSVPSEERKRTRDVPGSNRREERRSGDCRYGHCEADSAQHHHQDEPPQMGPDGQPMSYSLDHKEGGKRLREEQTLIDASVADGHHLIVYPEIVAGS